MASSLLRFAPKTSKNRLQGDFLPLQQAARAGNGEGVLLRVRNLKQYFRINRNYTVKAVDGVSFDIFPGETYGLVGESGSGKSTIGRTLIRLYKPSAGSIEFKGRDISGDMNTETRLILRTKMQMIFQDPMASLNPRKKVLEIISQGLRYHGLYSDREELTEKIHRIMDKVGLSRDFSGRYPHQFSGGQRQRIGIARALIMNPDLIIADEAISALDVSIQAQIVNLMKAVQQESGAALLFIAHDLTMVKYLSDRVGVLHRGRLVETGSKDEIFSHPVHPYTRSLFSAIPQPNPRLEKKRQVYLYDYKTSGLDYTLGTLRNIGGTHWVLGGDSELELWLKETGAKLP
ncbi:MAG: ATP-binding cassette domain-containing protein [Treponema sp.]|jgi:oligopeptide transport system ATP-binding protein|nr:ATP-binding cassette domain-containing protein [Treponema sp.]